MSQITIYLILFMTLGLFIYGRWRYDVVAILALLAVTLTGLVSPAEAFLGFGHPAVVTVAAVLAISVGLQNSGFVDLIYEFIIKKGKNFWAQLTLLCIVIAIISGFINNIGALAILLPVAIQTARSCKEPSSKILMPVAFSSLLGGMITMIGTPPNIIVALLREQHLGKPFTMFDFTPVGLGIATAGVAFIILVGWRLIPVRKGKAAKEDLFDVEDYLTELKVGKNSTCLEKTIKEFEVLAGGDLTVIAIVRKKKQISNPSRNESIQKGDILIVETDSETLEDLIKAFKVELLGDTKLSKEIIGADDMMVAEAVVKRDAPIIRKGIGDLRLRSRYGLNLLAISRSGKRVTNRLSQIKIQDGDLLLLRGTEQTIYEALPVLGCLPLESRGLTIGEPRRIFLSLAIFGLAVFSSALGYLQIQVAFLLAVVMMYFFGLLRLRDIYEAIDWPIVILLGALIPVGNALETTGAAQQLAEGILRLGGDQHPIIILIVAFVGTMFLSDIVNNATAAILMVPIAIRLATGLEVSPDPFLMAVAIGASCPFLTPIGHQCNTIILGPGGYRFGDYWRVGLPLEGVIVATGVPLILYFWPF